MTIVFTFSLSVFSQQAERGKFVLHKHRLSMGADYYEITTENGSIV